MKRIIAFMNGAKIDPEEIFDGDYFREDKPPDAGNKME